MRRAFTAHRTTETEARTHKAVRVYRLLRLLVHLLAGCVFVGVVFPFMSPRRRFRKISSWSRQLLGIMRVRYRVHGHLPAMRPLMIASNHVSWLDVWLINAVVGVRFVAKSEIKRWPLLGFLVSGAGTIFVHRTRRQDAARTNRHVVQALERGEHVAIFPEGITTDGTEVRPYHSSLFQPAVGARATVAVVALRYVRRSGEINDDAHYAGDRSLLESARRVLRHRVLHAEVIFAGEIDVSGKTRREIALQAEQITARALRLSPPHRKPGTPGGPPAESQTADVPTDNPNPAP